MTGIKSRTAQEQSRKGLFSPGARPSAGALDFGSRYLKMAVAGPGGTVESLEMTRTPRDEASLVEILADWSKRHRLGRIPVYSSLSGPGISIQHLSFPRMPEADLARAVEIEARQLLGEKLAEMDTDYLGWPENGDRARVLFVACPRAETDRLVSLLAAAGLEPGGVTIDGLALAGAWRESTAPLPGPSLLLDIGARITNFVVVHRSRPVFLRDITWGTGDLARSLGARTGEEPEKILDSLEKGPSPGDDFPSAGLDEATRPLVEELGKTRRYFQKVFGTEKILSFQLSGGGALVPGLPDILSGSLAMSPGAPAPSILASPESTGVPAELATLVAGLLRSPAARGVRAGT